MLWSPLLPEVFRCTLIILDLGWIKASNQPNILVAPWLLFSYFVAELLVCFLLLLIPHEVEVRKEALPSLLAYSSQLSNIPRKSKLEKLYCMFISSQDNCTAC